MTARQKLTPKQQAFCEHYLASGNATDAARKAGYKKPNPQGAENLAKPSIAEYIRTNALKQSKHRLMTAAERQELLAYFARSPKEDTKDRIKAVDTLNKMTGEYLQRVEVEATLSAEGVLSDVLDQLRE
jgi:phage terminase small subunit